MRYRPVMDTRRCRHQASMTDQKELQHNRRRLQPAIPAALAALAAGCIILTAAGGAWHDLNDDVLIDHILSGSYTGTPEFRSIQNLFPFSLAIAALYRVTDAVPWYGGALILLQLVSLFVILLRTGRAVRNAKKRIALAILFGLLYVTLALPHLVFIQYSMTVGMLCTAAACWFLTVPDAAFTPCAGGTRRPGRECAGAVVFLSAGFLIRSEMMLFLLPLAGAAFLLRAAAALTGNVLSGEPGSGIVPETQQADTTGGRLKRILRNTLTVFVPILAVMVTAAGVDAAAYHAGSWREFRNLFDARTQLYDFETIPPYEGNEAFYREIGFGPEDVELLENYNYALDDKINAASLQAVADYAKTAGQRPAGDRMRTALWDYRHTFLARDELPYNLIVAVLYGLVLYLSALRLGTAGLLQRLPGKEGTGPGTRGGAAFDLLSAAFVFLIRSGLWMYLEYNRRPVTRLTHSLYLMEALLLLWILFREDLSGVPQAESSPEVLLNRVRRIRFAAKYSVLLAILAAALSVQVRGIRSELALREAANRPYTALLDYCAAHPESSYYLDVYSTVSFSERIRGSEDIPGNFDLLGGWAAYSPLWKQKAEQLGAAEGPFTGLLQEDSRFVVRNGEDLSWLREFYAGRGITVQTETVDEIGGFFDVVCLSETE